MSVEMLYYIVLRSRQKSSSVPLVRACMPGAAAVRVVFEIFTKTVEYISVSDFLLLTCKIFYDICCEFILHLRCHLYVRCFYQTN